MWYKEILPDDRLKTIVKSYFLYESHSSDTFDDTVLPSGSIEIVFNLGHGKWKVRSEEDRLITNPEIELWGQITKPLRIRSVGKNTMMGVRFQPQGAAWLLRENATLFNNQVSDLKDIWGSEVQQLHHMLLEARSWGDRIRMTESFLIGKCQSFSQHFPKVELINAILDQLANDDTELSVEDVASRFGMSPRYMQKIVVEYTGLSPKLYRQINRFQKSLRLVTKKELSLTSVAYDCGYFDQSHFIREFKSFTGHTPSSYSGTNSFFNSASVH